MIGEKAGVWERVGDATGVWDRGAGVWEREGWMGEATGVEGLADIDAEREWNRVTAEKGLWRALAEYGAGEVGGEGGSSTNGVEWGNWDGCAPSDPANNLSAEISARSS